MSGADGFALKPKAVPRVSTRFRRIKTRLPAPASVAMLRALERVESRSMHGQLPVVWHRARNASVEDAAGNRWIDFTSTIFVANAGHSHPRIVRAIRDQAARELLHSYTFATEVRTRFIKALVRAAPDFQKAYLVSAGTEATEAAFKLMRLNGMAQNPRKVHVIAFQGSMHGRTMGAELLKNNPAGTAWIAHRDPHLHHLVFPAPWTVPDPARADWGKIFKRDIAVLLRREKIRPRDIAGFMLESYIGWGALFFPPPYVKALSRFARAQGALVTFDEIQGGFGRTGKLFVYQHYGVKPDLICIGKGVSSSLPMAGVLGSRRVLDLPPIGSMSSTHSASPLPCAAALANLEVLKREGLVKKAARDGAYMHGRLRALQARFPRRIQYVFGHGLLGAVLTRDPLTGKPDGEFATNVCLRAMHKGLLLVHTGRESIKLGPPLTIPRAALAEGLDVLEECFQEIDREARGA